MAELAKKLNFDLQRDVYQSLFDKFSVEQTSNVYQIWEGNSFTFGSLVSV